VDGVVEGLALFSGALLLRNVLSHLVLFKGGIDSPFQKLVLHPHGGLLRRREGDGKEDSVRAEWMEWCRGWPCLAAPSGDGKDHSVRAEWMEWCRGWPCLAAPSSCGMSLGGD